MQKSGGELSGAVLSSATLCSGSCMKRRRCGMRKSELFLRLIVATGAVTMHAWADHDRPVIFPPKSRPAEVRPTFEEWSARWWQWALSIPVDKNPTLDQTGANCDVGQ